MPRPIDPALVTQVQTDLAIDRYLTTEQCFRRYGLSEHSIKTIRRAGLVRTTPAELRPTQWSRMAIPVMLVSPAHRRINPDTVVGIPHFLGLAEVRWLLRDRIRSWDADVQDTEQAHRIDVVAYDDEGELLVEYDTGLYKPTHVLRKAEMARSLGRRQLWATPSEAKATKLSGLVPDAEVWLVCWDDGRAEMVHTGAASSA